MRRRGPEPQLPFTCRWRRCIIPDMSRAVAILGILALTLLLACVGAGVMLARDRLGLGGPIYALSQVETGLQRHPTQWLGRTVRIQARVVPGLTACGTGSACVWVAEPALVDAQDGEVSAGAQFLMLRPGPQDSLIDMIRRLPGIDRVLPRPHAGRPGAIYAVRIGPAAPDTLCLRPPCYQATLVEGDVSASSLGSSPGLPGPSQAAQ